MWYRNTNGFPLMKYCMNTLYVRNMGCTIHGTCVILQLGVHCCALLRRSCDKITYRRTPYQHGVFFADPWDTLYINIEGCCKMPVGTSCVDYGVRTKYVVRYYPWLRNLTQCYVIFQEKHFPRKRKHPCWYVILYYVFVQVSFIFLECVN